MNPEQAVLSGDLAGGVWGRCRKSAMCDEVGDDIRKKKVDVCGVLETRDDRVRVQDLLVRGVRDISFSGKGR